MTQFQAQSKGLLHVLFAALLVAVFSGEVRASEAWKSLRGHAVCGGIDEYGRLQPPCAPTRATYVGKAVTQCPKGSFSDLGTCWTCPTGYVRTANKVDGDRACSKAADKVVTSAATFKGAAQCPSGIYDPRNGGECWKCDAGFGRTAAPVNEWNACGKFGAKARSATFVSRICPTDGAFLDKRNGGECWVCPPGYDRTLNPVTGANACKLEIQFSKAIERGDFLCKPGEVYDLIDGGTCWTCPPNYKRTWGSIKSNTACYNNQMEWGMPKRQVYGLFGMGWGARDILAQMIAERTKIDAAITKLAQFAKEDEATLRKNAWQVIDSKPWESPILSALLQEAATVAALKSPAEQTPAEKDLVERVEKIIQWNRQFVAYQAKQAHETWVKASKASYDVALSKMGAAAVYADSMVTPPDYNEVLVGAIQLGAGFAGPPGAALYTQLIPSATKFVRPFAGRGREAVKLAEKVAEKTAKKAAEKVVQELAKKTGEAIVEGAATTSGSAAAAAAGPMIIVAAATVIMTMEIDKFMALEKADAQIANAIRKADAPVVLKTLLQMDGGPEEFLFHWAAAINEPVKPDADYQARYNAYKSGKTPTTTSSISLPDNLTVTGTVHQAGTVVHQRPQQPQIQVQLTPVTSTQQTVNVAQPSVQPTTAVTTTPNPPNGEPNTGNQLASLIQQDVLSQPRTAPQGAMRIEGSNHPNLCIAKKSGLDRELNVAHCRNRQALWIVPDTARNILLAAGKYCLDTTETEMRGTTALKPGHPVIAECRENDSGQKWQISQEGFIRHLDTGLCLVMNKGKDVILQKCGMSAAFEKWRPWVGRK